MRLIDADALRKEHCEGCASSVQDGCKTDPVCASLMWVHDAPTIDAVPVVRCAECKYWLFVEDGFGDCTNRRFHLDGCADPSMKMDDFCSIGERRSE